MNSKKLLLILFVLSLSSCGTTGKTGESLDYKEMVDKVQNLDFKIENEWANAVKFGRVNLLSNPNHITFEGDSVDVFLPFFGERHSGGGYGTGGAIEYEGLLKDLNIEEQPDKDRILLSFKGDHQTENLDFHLIIFPNGKTTTTVNSSQRDAIQYDGRIKSLE